MQNGGSAQERKWQGPNSLEFTFLLFLVLVSFFLLGLLNRVDSLGLIMLLAVGVVLAAVIGILAKTFFLR
jgi:hypothetical protein